MDTAQFYNWMQGFIDINFPPLFTVWFVVSGIMLMALVIPLGLTAFDAHSDRYVRAWCRLMLVILGGFGAVALFRYAFNSTTCSYFGVF